MPLIKLSTVIGRLQAVFALLLLFAAPLRLEAATVADEYELKAALIYKLSKFVQWPDTTSNEAPDVFGICVLGEGCVQHGRLLPRQYVPLLASTKYGHSVEFRSP